MTILSPTRREHNSAADPQSISLDERRMARRAFVRQLRLARVRSEPTVTLPLSIAQALRAIVVTTLGASIPGGCESERAS